MDPFLGYWRFRMTKCGSQRLLARTVTLVLSSLPAFAQSGGRMPAYELLRYEEDWSALRNRERRSGSMDSLKYAPFGRNPRDLVATGQGPFSRDARAILWL